MSDPQAAGAASAAAPEPTPTHRQRPRRRAARPAGPPPSSPPEPVVPADVAPTRTRTKARHSARGGEKAARAPEAAEADPPAKAAERTRAQAPERTRAQAPAKSPAKAPARRGRPSSGGRDDGVDAAWRDLAGGGPSKVGLSGALRARDVDRPTAADMAEAERSVVIVRRDPTGLAQPAGQASAPPTSGRQAADKRAAGQRNAAATGDAPARRGRRQRPSGAGI